MDQSSELPSIEVLRNAPGGGLDRGVDVPAVPDDQQAPGLHSHPNPVPRMVSFHIGSSCMQNVVV